jgi:hypothetical protein
VLAAKVRALLEGRYNVGFEDVRRVCLPALRHRILLNFEAQAENVPADAVLSQVLKEVKDRVADGTPARGRRSLWRLLDFLGKIEPAGPSNLARAMKDFPVRSSGKGVVVVLGDFRDKGGYEDGLRYLVPRQMDVYAIQILSREEIEPEVVGDLQLVDVEDADVAEIAVNGPLLKRYKQNLAAYRDALHQFCTRRGVACLFTSTAAPFDRLVLTYLRQRGLVR